MSNKKHPSLAERAEAVMGHLCDPGCEGRCLECPADVMRDFIKLIPFEEAERELSAAYLRLRQRIPGALDTPHAPTAQQVWSVTESALDRLLLRGIDWQPIATFKPRAGKHWLFWQPACMNRRIPLGARVVTDSDVPMMPRPTTHWAEINGPTDASENQERAAQAVHEAAKAQGLGLDLAQCAPLAYAAVGDPPPALFVYVDWSPRREDPTRLTVFERVKGWQLKTRASRRFVSDDPDHIAHEIAKLCAEHQCIPVIDSIGFGGVLLDKVSRLLGDKWPPPPAELRFDRRVRHL